MQRHKGLARHKHYALYYWHTTNLNRGHSEMNLKTSKGFTIVELLIVIVVIAILAAISIVAYTGIQDRARNSASLELANQVAGKARALHAITGSYPANVAGFTNSEAPEAALGGANVVDGTAAPASSVTAFWNGTQVVYNTTSGSHGVIYRTGASTSGEIELR